MVVVLFRPVANFASNDYFYALDYSLQQPIVVVAVLSDFQFYFVWERKVGSYEEKTMFVGIEAEPKIRK
jgi:hypothetical protein